MTDSNLEIWHQIVEERDWNLLQKILADEVEFHSPFVWKPKVGRGITAFILQNVTDIFEHFTYHREWSQDGEMALEFSAEINGLQIKGIDLIKFNSQNQIEKFEVMLRPANALMIVGQEMSSRIKKAGLDEPS